MTSTPHDALFKSMFSEPEEAAAELRSVLPPKLAGRIDWATLALVPGSFIDEKLTERESDLLFEVRASDARLKLHLLFEHQSTAPPLMAFRLLRYMVRIWEGEVAAEPERITLTPIVPVVLHHSERGWTAATSFGALLELGELAGTGIESLVPEFSFVLDDVSAQSDDDIARRLGSKVVRATLGALREARRTRGDGPRLIRGLARLLLELRASGRPEAYLRILRYLLTVAASDAPGPFLDAVSVEIGPQAKDEAMGLLDSMYERGRSEGLAHGKAEGKAEGEAAGRAEGEAAGRRATLGKQLQLKFGLVPPWVIAALDAMDLAALDAASERILVAARVEDVVPTE